MSISRLRPAKRSSVLAKRTAVRFLSPLRLLTDATTSHPDLTLTALPDTIRLAYKLETLAQKLLDQLYEFFCKVITGKNDLHGANGTTTGRCPDVEICQFLYLYQCKFAGA